MSATLGPGPLRRQLTCASGAMMSSAKKMLQGDGLLACPCPASSPAFMHVFDMLTQVTRHQEVSRQAAT